MIVEMGESLIKSWLRHSIGCQIVQDNWKVSKTWNLGNIVLIEEIFKYFNEYYYDKFGDKLFSDSSTIFQILKQGEIDLFGVKIENMEISSIFAVEVAFHENGLNYNKGTKTTESVVIMKLVRAICTMIGFFNVKEGNIVFATPKISRPKEVRMIEEVNELQRIVNEKWGFHFSLSFVANNNFREQIFDVVNNLSVDVADTSELYMRARQLQDIMNQTE